MKADNDILGADVCIDCDGAGQYPSGAKCKSCLGSGQVLLGDGISDRRPSSEVRSMTDNLERLRTELADVKLSAQLRLDRLVEANDRLEEERANSKRLQEALAAAETEHEKQIATLQSALAFWMPSITEAIEIELNGRAGDDAYLLAGFNGEVPVPSWGDKAISRAEAAEAKLASLPALLAETRKKALEEAAQVAENTVDFNDDGLSTFDASQIIAAAIRALAEEVRT